MLGHYKKNWIWLQNLLRVKSPQQPIERQKPYKLEKSSISVLQLKIIFKNTSWWPLAATEHLLADLGRQ
jgi:hypothetical protein